MSVRFGIYRCTQDLLDTKRHRRDQVSIIAKMLEISKKGALKTQIMYQANLSYTLLNGYLDFLIKKELITQIVIHDKEIYKITQKGMNYLQTHRELLKLIGKNSDKKSSVF